MQRSIVFCAERIRQGLRKKVVETIGYDSGFARRERKLTAVRAIWTLATGMASGTATTIADFWRLFIDLSGQRIEYKAFHVRLANRRFPEFLRQVLETLMGELSFPVLEYRSPLLKRFRDIVLQDGSSFAVNDELADVFPGRFTKISPGAVEIHCTYSLREGQPESIAIAPDKEGERQFLPSPEELKGKLLLVDRGYLSYPYFEEVKAAGGDFIGRARDRRFSPKILKCYRGFREKKGVVGKRLNEVTLPNCNVDLLVEGKDSKMKKHQVRLVLFYVRRKKLHLRLLTSLCPREFKPGTVASMYRLRWQIELFFKECKSYTRLRKFQTKDPHIVEGLIWASMIAILLRRFLLHSAFNHARERPSHFIAASLSWTFFRDIARSGVNGLRGLPKQLERALTLLRHFAEATNPRRETTFDLLDIKPIRGYA